MTTPPHPRRRAVRHRVRGKGDGLTLAAYLRQVFGPEEDGRLLEAVALGRFRLLDGPTLAAESVVRAGQTLEADVTHRVEEEPWLAPPPLELDVPFADEHLIVIDKTAGLLCYPVGPRWVSALTILERQLHRAGEPFELRPSHRLDKETSGLLMFARQIEADRGIKAAFKDGAVKKTYVAIVRGRLDRERVVDAPIASDSGGAIRVRMRIGDDGREARTEVTPLGCFGDKDWGPAGRGWSWVEARPITGRTHQIRLHLAHLGHPIVGDKIYCDDGIAFLKRWDNDLKAEDLERLELPRQALHARTLAFDHPLGGAPVALTAPIPADMLSFAEQRGGGAPAWPEL